MSFNSHVQFRLKRINFTRNLPDWLLLSNLKRGIYLVFVATINLMLVACDSGGSSKNETVIPPELTQLDEKIDFYLTQNQLHTTPGISVVVRKDQQIVYQLSKGMADVNQGASITPDTGFRVGSISKVFTALAVFQLVEQQQIHLDDLLLDYIPELHQALGEITIRHLLTHQSGIPDYWNDFDQHDQYDAMTIDTFIELNRNFTELEFTPGSQSDYSNTGYVLLAAIIERITGQPFPEYLQTQFFIPLAMANSYVINSQRNIGQNGELTAYNFAEYDTVFNIRFFMYGSSGVVSSTNDLLLFLDGLYNQQIVSHATMELMTTTASHIPNVGNFGLGWLTGTTQSDIFNQNDYWHSGGFDGYRSLLVVSPEKGYDYVVLTNGGDETGDHTWEILKIIKAHYQ